MQINAKQASAQFKLNKDTGHISKIMEENKNKKNKRTKKNTIKEMDCFGLMVEILDEDMN